MISIDNLSFAFGGRQIYENTSLHIKSGDRIGLIGRNGAGKSTLLRLIYGEYRPDSGQISKPNDCTIGFLNQDLLSFHSEKSIMDIAMEGFDKAVALQKEIDDLLHKIETDPSEKNIEALTEKQELFEKLGGYEMESKASSALEQLGFSTEQLSKPLSSFSGGWRMRVILAKLLLQGPSLLMLDEPTNHLDLPTIEWLEQYLVNYPGALILVSHDREFLNNVVNRIVETGNETLTSYVGNYDKYEEERALRMEIQQGAYENQQKMIRQTEAFISRFRAKASKARQVQSRVKSLEKIDKVDAVEDDAPVMNLRFKPKVMSGKEVVQIKEFSKSYGDLDIFKNSNMETLRGDKIALVGANGRGKSTLLRMVFGTEPFEGEKKIGHNVEMAFYAQHQLESLTLTNTIFEELRQSGAERTDTEIRTILGCFLFSGEEVEKPIKVLSGGEKARVALAKVLVSDSNVLLLDEPTNHLDAVSVDMLIQAINNFEGTVLIVSHSRYFIKHTANKIWYIQNHELKEYPGTWDEYDYWRKKNPIVQTTTSAKEQKPKQTVQKPQSSSATASAQPAKTNKELEKIEQQIMELEDSLGDLEKEMAKALEEQNGNYERLHQSYQKLNKELEALQLEWEKWVG